MKARLTRSVRSLVPALVLAAAAAGAVRADEPAALFGALCAACHGTGTVPLSGGPYPALFANPQIAAAGAVYVALKAQHGTGNMYPFCALAGDAEITAIANYLAAANGNQGPPLTVEAVAALRPAAGDCPVPH